MHYMGIIVPNKKTRKNWNKIGIYWTCWAGYFKKSLEVV